MKHRWVYLFTDNHCIGISTWQRKVVQSGMARPRYFIPSLFHLKAIRLKTFKIFFITCSVGGHTFYGHQSPVINRDHSYHVRVPQMNNILQSTDINFQSSTIDHDHSYHEEAPQEVHTQQGHRWGQGQTFYLDVYFL